MKRMIMIIMMMVALSFIISISSYACDREAALDVQTMLREMGTWQEENGTIIFTWGSDWDYSNSEQRLGLIKAFADSDACLEGTARKIK